MTCGKCKSQALHGCALYLNLLHLSSNEALWSISTWVLETGALSTAGALLKAVHGQREPGVVAVCLASDIVDLQHEMQ